MARKAQSLEVLAKQLDTLFPNRMKPDGWIGDAAHAARKSDHNPNAAGVVQALDVSHDPANGLDGGSLADKLLASRDPRIKYVISNGRIGASYATGGAMPYTWRPYTGANSHHAHFHVSVKDEASFYDDPSAWVLGSVLVPEPLPRPPVNSNAYQVMAKKIINYEYDKRPFKIYTVGDGSREIAGLNEAKHPDYFKRVEAKVGDDAAVEREVAAFYIAYTNLASTWTANLGVEFYLRDCIVNRGPTGAAIILQKAVGAEEDGAVGPVTKQKMVGISPSDLLNKLDAAREVYELQKYGKREHLWKGLNNRWDKALRDAWVYLEIATPEPTPVPIPVPIPEPSPAPEPPLIPIFTPAPPPPTQIDFARLERLNTLDIEKILAAQEAAMRQIEIAHSEIIAKMKIGNPAGPIQETPAMSNFNTGGSAIVPASVVVPTKSSWMSKINWVQFGAPLISGILAYVADMPPDKVIGGVIGVQVIQSVLTWVMRTWFTNAITAASLPTR